MLLLLCGYAAVVLANVRMWWVRHGDMTAIQRLRVDRKHEPMLAHRSLPGIDYPVGQFPVGWVEGGKTPPLSSNVLLTPSKFFFLLLKEKTLFFPLKRIGFIHCVSGFMLGFAVFSFTWNKAIKSLNIDRAGLSSQPNVVWTKISPLHPRSTRWKQVCHSNSISSQKSRFWKAHQC